MQLSFDSAVESFYSGKVFQDTENFHKEQEFRRYSGSLYFHSIFLISHLNPSYAVEIFFFNVISFERSVKTFYLIFAANVIK